MLDRGPIVFGSDNEKAADPNRGPRLQLRRKVGDLSGATGGVVPGAGLADLDAVHDGQGADGRAIPSDPNAGRQGAGGLAAEGLLARGLLDRLDRLGTEAGATTRGRANLSPAVALRACERIHLLIGDGKPRWDELRERDRCCVV